MERDMTIPQSAPLTAPFTQGGLIIGITGGTGCGKTTLLNEVKKKGGLVLDCDAIYHELLKTDAGLLSAIDARFPGVVEGGSLNRKKLGGIVFGDEKALTDLNAITHKAVKAEVTRRIPEAPALVAIDAIALFESGLAELCHVTVAVTAPAEDRVKRLMIRDGISEAYARARIAAQHEESWFRERCDHVLSNDADYQSFQSKCLAFLEIVAIMST